MSHRPTSRPNAATSNRLLQDGARLFETGQYAEACQCFERALEKEPRNPMALWHTGRTLILLNQPKQAIPLLEQAVEMRPDAPKARYDLGMAYGNAQRAEKAMESFRAATVLKPDWAQAWSHLGNAQAQARQYTEAEATLRHALTLTGYREETLNHLGLVVAARGRHDEAVEYFMQALQGRPKFFQAWTNLGNTLAAQNKLDEAIFAYQHSLALEPKNPVTKFNLALMHLTQGKLGREAWLKYEYRWVTLHISPHRGFQQPLWRGAESLAGKSILLYAEQGLGDTLQFIRFAPVLAAQGATVHVEVQPALKTLLQSIPGPVSILGKGEPLPHFDFQCPLLSVPFALDTHLDSIPADVPYLKAPPDRMEIWRQRLPAAERLRVGVVWRGNPKHSNDANRSLPFETLRRLFDTAGCQFVGLQMGLNEMESATFAGNNRCVDPTKQIADFSDTAAIVSQLDLVVAVDTSVAHLAGALGKPVWLLVPFRPDWRWLLGRTDSPWYPQMRLFRQPAIGDWDAVVTAVCGELTCLAPALEAPPAKAAVPLCA